MPRPNANLRAEPASLPDHILVRETIEKFGTDPRLLKPSSERLVVVQCSACGEHLDRKFRGAVKLRMCLTCSNRIRARETVAARALALREHYASGAKHPRQGVQHTEEARAKISASRKGWKFSLSIEARRRAAEQCMARLNTPEMKARTAALNSARVGPLSPSYGKPPAHTKKVWHTKPNGQRVCFRSTWEAAFADWMDRRGIEWEYEAEVFPVKYMDEEVERDGTYRPDFTIGDTLFEVKGRWTRGGLAKFEAFRTQYPDRKITLVDREMLNDLGVI